MYDVEEAVAIVSNAVMVKTTPQDWVDAVLSQSPQIGSSVQRRALEKKR